MDATEKKLYLSSISFSNNLFKILTDMGDYQIIKDMNTNPKFNERVKALIIFLIKYHNKDPELISYLDEHINIQSEQRVYNLNIFLKTMSATNWVDKLNDMEFSTIITIIYNDIYELINIYEHTVNLGIKKFIINKLLDFSTSDKTMENKYEKISQTLNSIKAFIDNFSDINDINVINTNFLIKLIYQLLVRDKDILTQNYYLYLIRSLEKNEDKIIDYVNLIKNIKELAEEFNHNAEPLILFFNKLFILIKRTDGKNYNFIKKIVMNSLYYNIIIFCFETNYDIIKTGLIYLIESKICSIYPEFKQGCIDIIKYYDMHPELLIKTDDSYDYCIIADFIDEECTKKLDIYNYNNDFENKYFKNYLSGRLKEKTLKYKNKYLKLKKQFGGQIDKSDNAYALFLKVYTDDNIRDLKKYKRDPFFQDGGQINDLYKWYMEVNPEWRSMKHNNRPMIEYKYLIAGMIKDLYAKYIEYEESGREYNEVKKQKIREIIIEINTMITNNFIYREIIGSIISYLTFFDSIIAYSCGSDCIILKNLIDSPFIIFPTFILYNFDKVILTMKAPFINFHLSYDQVRIHEAPSEPPSKQIGHDINIHYNISTFNCIEEILGIKPSLDTNEYEHIYETLYGLIELIKTYFNFMNITITKLQSSFRPVSKDNLFIHTLFILLHEGTASGSAFIEHAIKILTKENNKALQDFRKEKSTTNLELLFSEITRNFNRIAKSIVDNLGPLVSDDMICYIYTKNLAMYCYESYSMGKEFKIDPEFKRAHQLPPDFDVKQDFITKVKHNIDQIHAILNT